MLVAAAVVPCAPLLVPQVAAGAAPELAPLRTACSDAVAVLAAARPDRLVVVGPGEAGQQGPYPQGSVGTFRGFGVDHEVRLGAGGVDGPEQRALPAPLTVAAWLLDRTDWSGPVTGYCVETSASADRCAEAGRRLAAGAERVAVLVAGDGSACRSLKAPGYLDDRAGVFDGEVARALGAADGQALLRLDPALAAELHAVGRAPWQVLAGAADGAGLGGHLFYDEAPYGVGYLVAAWS